MLKAIKVRIYPTKQQEDYISRLLGSCRFIYNKCLEFKISTYNMTKKSTNLSDTSRFLVEMKQKEEFSWLRDVHSKVLQQSLINLETAYKSFFKNGTGFPKFKAKRRGEDSCRFPVDAFSGIRGNRVDIIRPLKDIHFKCSRRDEIILNSHQSKIRSATLERDKTGKFFLSILLDMSIRQPEKVNGSIGLDVGIKDFIVTSDGKRFENLKIKRNNERKLAKLCRSHSRKKLGGKNREKARLRLAAFHKKLNNQKEHYLHSVANSILKDNQLIVIEDLNVRGMMKNRKLAKSIQELSLNRFKSILTYKAGWYGKDIIQVDRFFPSSKLCSNCGFKNSSLTLNQRVWTCPECGVTHDRDWNAAKNILNEGLKLQKIGSSSPESTLVEIEPMALEPSSKVKFGRGSKKRM